MPYDIEIIGLEEMQRKFSESPKIVGEVLSDATIEAGKSIFRQAVKEAPHNTGNMQRTMHMEFTPIQVEVKPTAHYAHGVEFGTQPHVVPYSEIAPWAIKKGLNPWAVINSIKKKGTRANPFMGRTRGLVEGLVQGIYAKALETITNLMAK